MPRPSARLSDVLHGLEKLAFGVRARRLPSALIEAPAILQFQTVVEAEEVRSTHRTVGSNDVLALIVG